MSDSALGDSAVTSPIMGGNLCDDSVQMLSPTRQRGKFDSSIFLVLYVKTRFSVRNLERKINILWYRIIGEMNNQLPTKSQCSSLGSDREENFESYGENDVGIDDEK